MMIFLNIFIIIIIIIFFFFFFFLGGGERRAWINQKPPRPWPLMPHLIDLNAPLRNHTKLKAW